MRVKTAYKSPPESPVEINAAVVPQDDDVLIPGEHEAASELKSQMAALRHATTHQREQVQHETPSLDESRAARIAEWRQQGLPEADASFLESHPTLIDHPQLAQASASEAIQAGHTPGSEAFYEHTRQRFDHHLGQIKEREVAAQASPPAEETVPEVFRPKRAPAQDQGSIVSAPVSRDAPTTSYRAPGVAADARSVRLTVEQRQIAKASGISEVQYAENLMRLQREKDQGLHQR